MHCGLRRYGELKSRSEFETINRYKRQVFPILVDATRECNPGKPADFQTRKPGFVCGQKPGSDGFKFRLSVLQTTARINRKELK